MIWTASAAMWIIELHYKMTKFYLVIVLISFLWTSSAVFGELIVVKTPRQTSSSCFLPPSVDLTILRHQRDDVILTLKTNVMITVPTTVVLMSSDDVTSKTNFQREEVSAIGGAYHSTENEAAMIVRCSIDDLTKSSFFKFEGTLVIDGLLYKMVPTQDDVLMEPDDVTSTYVLEEVEEENVSLRHDFEKFTTLDRMHSKLPGADQSSGRDHSRMKREVTNYYLDVLPVIDYKLYTRFLSANSNNSPRTKTAIASYITTIFTSVSLRLQTLDLHSNVVLTIRMLDPHISTDSATSKFTEDNKTPYEGGTHLVNIVNQIEDFRDWTLDTDLPYNDHVMLFSGYEKYGRENSTTNLGLAYLGGICDRNGFSRSVVRDLMGYQSEGPATHEFGHSLGSNHDGDDNECDSGGRYVMAPNVQNPRQDNLLNPFQFSPCSSEEISNFIKVLEASESLDTCLIPTSGSVLPQAAQTESHIQDQCHTLYGDDSFYCVGRPGLPALSDICSTAFCAVGAYCTHIIPATGTCCGNGKSCLEGRCTDAPSGQCVRSEECAYTDNPYCVSIAPEDCFDDQVYLVCCRVCKIYLKAVAPPPYPPQIKVNGDLIAHGGSVLVDLDSILNVECRVDGGFPVVSGVSIDCTGLTITTSDGVEVTKSFRASRSTAGAVCVCAADHITGSYDQVTSFTLAINDSFVPEVSIKSTVNIGMMGDFQLTVTALQVVKGVKLVKYKRNAADGSIRMVKEFDPSEFLAEINNNGGSQDQVTINVYDLDPSESYFYTLTLTDPTGTSLDFSFNSSLTQGDSSSRLDHDSQDMSFVNLCVTSTLLGLCAVILTLATVLYMKNFPTKPTRSKRCGSPKSSIKISPQPPDTSTA